jgi:hypothetical protein
MLRCQTSGCEAESARRDLIRGLFSYVFSSDYIVSNSGIIIYSSITENAKDSAQGPV